MYITYSLHLLCAAENFGPAFDHLKSQLTTIENSTAAHMKEFHQFRDQVLHELASLRNDLTRLDDLVHACGGTGWKRVAYLNMTDPSTTCPDGWNITAYHKRTCGRASPG